MSYVYVKYPLPIGQCYPSFGVLRSDNIDLAKFKPNNTQINGVDEYYKDDK